MANDEHPCPACGFLVFLDPPGSFDICPVCEWEDDAVQLRHPSMGGGANDESLVAVQRRVLRDHPLDVKQVKDFTREPEWRPLTDEEATRDAPRSQQPVSGEGYFEAAAEEAPPYYWRKG
jgi:hypothetical protein